MTKSIFIWILITPIVAFSQKNGKGDTSLPVIVMSESVLKDLDKSAFQIFVSRYSDSINNATILLELPSFLKDEDFDFHHSNFWFPGNYNISLRNIIIEHVNNCRGIKLILDNASGVFKQKSNKYYGLDFANLSFYDLALKRYRELACDK